jgi:hypothetical protein
VIDVSAARRLGEVLTGSEAGGIADRLADGQTLTVALRAVPPGRRTTVRALLVSAGDDVSHLVPVLRAIEGARSITTMADPMWTMPGHLAGSGRLTSSVVHLVDGSRVSVTCSTFNS